MPSTHSSMPALGVKGTTYFIINIAFIHSHSKIDSKKKKRTNLFRMNVFFSLATELTEIGSSIFYSHLSGTKNFKNRIYQETN